MIKFVKFFKAVAKPTNAVEADAVYIVPAQDANKCLVYVANNTGTKLLQVTDEDNATGTDTEARRIAQEALDAAQQAKAKTDTIDALKGRVDTLESNPPAAEDRQARTDAETAKESARQANQAVTGLTTRVEGVERGLGQKADKTKTEEALSKAQQAALDAGSAKNLASHASSAANSAQSAASAATNEIEGIKQRLTILEGKVP